MAEIVNLRSHRRRRQRNEEAAEAADNRARFGRTRAEILRDETGRARLEQALDNARIEPPPTAE